MIKTLAILFAGLAVAGLSATPAFAADHYVSGSAGLSWFNDSDWQFTDNQDSSNKLSFDSGLILLGAIGCDYGDYRLEAEIGYQKNDIDELNFPDQLNLAGAAYPAEGSVSVLSLMANGYYDFELGSGVELYASAGVGVAQVDVEDYDHALIDGPVSASETTLAWQVGAGIAVPIAENIMVDARYRYFAITDFTALGYNIDGSSHNALIGLRVGL